MRPPGIIRSNNVAHMTNQELAQVMREIGPCGSTDVGVIVSAEIKRRSQVRAWRWKVAAAIVTIIITAIASNWHDFLWWVSHGFELR